MKKKVLWTVQFLIILLLIASCDIIGIENPFQLGEQTTVRKAPPDNPPAIRTAADNGFEGMNISWAAVPYAESYTLKWRVDGGEWNTQPGLSIPLFNIPRDRVDIGQTLEYMIQASNSYGSTDFSVSQSSIYNIEFPLYQQWQADGTLLVYWEILPGATSYDLTQTPNTAATKSITHPFLFTSSLSINFKNNNALFFTDVAGSFSNSKSAAENILNIEVTARSGTNTATSTTSFPIHLGSGTAADPFLIFHQQDLHTLRTHQDKYFKLMTPMSITSDWDPIEGIFSGTFDGNFHTLSNLTISTLPSKGSGFFEHIDNGALIKNLNLSIKRIPISTTNEADTKCGGLAMTAGLYNSTTQIENCHILDEDEDGRGIYGDDAENGAKYTGGLVGVGAPQIINCSSNLPIRSNTEDSKIGGIIGYVNSQSAGQCIIEKSYTNNEISSLLYSSSESGLGGITGAAGTYVIIRQCFTTGEIQTNQNTAPITNAGGIIGKIYSSGAGSIIENCYSTMDITGYGDNSGGIAGNIFNSTLRNNLSSGNITRSGQSTGGIVGLAFSSNVNNPCSIDRNLAISDQVGHTETGSANVGRIWNSGPVLPVAHNYGFEYMNIVHADGIFQYPTSGTVSDKLGKPFNIDNIKTSTPETTVPFSNWDFDTIWRMSLNGPILRAFTHAGGWPANRTEPNQDPVE